MFFVFYFLSFSFLLRKKSSPHIIYHMVLEKLRGTAKWSATKSLEFIAFFHFSLKESYKLHVFVHEHIYTSFYAGTQVTHVLCKKVLSKAKAPTASSLAPFPHRMAQGHLQGEAGMHPPVFSPFSVFFEAHIGMYLLLKACIFSSTVL